MRACWPRGGASTTALAWVGFFSRKKKKKKRAKRVKTEAKSFLSLYSLSLPPPLRKKKRNGEKDKSGKRGTKTTRRHTLLRLSCSDFLLLREDKTVLSRSRASASQKKATAQQQATAKTRICFFLSPPLAAAVATSFERNKQTKIEKMNDAPADYVKLAPARHPPRAAAETPEGRAWRRYRDPLVTKMVRKFFIFD